ncbi:MAG: hypothetical protein C4309_02975, partial [Chloroflexota bacterium]
LGLDQLQRALQELWRQLRAAGMTPETLARLRQIAAANQQAMQDELERAFGLPQEQRPLNWRYPRSDYDLMRRPFHTLTPA